MSFNAQEDKVRELFNRKVYCIPRNQRKYVWKKDNWRELFEDVLCVVDGKIASHFIGSIVLSQLPMENGLPRHAVIDGQQRTITISILLTSIMFQMKKLDMMSDFNGTKPYIIAKDDKDNDVVMVTAENGESLERIVSEVMEMTVDEAKEKSINALVDSNIICRADKNIGDAFKYFMSEISQYYESNGNSKDKILALRDAVRDITFVNITAVDEADSYTIFEILNARGLDLEAHELLKNYIMRYIHPEASRDRAKEGWSAIENKLGATNLKKFIRHYTTHKYGDQRTNNAPSDYKIIQINNKDKNTKKLLDDLQLKSEYYLKLISPCSSGEDSNCNEVEFRVFSFFKRKNHEQMRPLILSLITKNKEGKLSDKIYNKTIDFLYNFYVCYNIIGEENSNKLTNVINKYSAQIDKNYSDELIEKLVAELRTKLPTKEMFINAFKNVGWSHHSSIYEGEKNKNRVQTVLEVLERFMNNGNCCEDLTIEHILADCEDGTNGQIGNLIPLEENINTNQCKSKPVEEKLKFYSTSSFITARNVACRYEKKQFDAAERTKYMAEQFYDEILKL